MGGKLTFTDDEVERCKAAMSKPAPLAALRAIASGSVLIELTPDRRDICVELGGERMFVAGGWPLYRAGMIDEYGCVTSAGRQALGASDE